MIAQYSPALLLAWEGHAHIDFALSLYTFVYIFKYINKGPDYCEFRLRPTEEASEDAYEDAALAAADEFQRARYISATEAAWRLYGFTLCTKEPTVDRLGVHLPGQNTAQFRGRSGIGSEASKLIRYFLRPASYAENTYTAYWEAVTSLSATREQLTGTAPLPVGGELERTEPGMSFKPKIIRRRQRGMCIARIKSVRPGSGEVFYLRQLLLHRAAQSWKDLKTTALGTPNQVVHDTFQAAAVELGLFEHGSEATLAMREAVELFQPPSELRFLFSILVLDGAIATRLWDEFRLPLLRDFLPRTLGTEPSTLETQQACDAGLRSISNTLEEMGCDPAVHGLPRAQVRPAEVEAELSHFAPQRRAMRVAADHARGAFNPEQAALYATLLEAVTQEGEVRGGGKADVLANSFRASPIFPLFKLHELHQPVRTGADPEFSEWVDAVGEDGTSADIDLSSFFRCTTSLSEAREFLFPVEVLDNATVAARRAFLSPFNVDVSAFNEGVLDRLPGRVGTYSSFDHLKGEDGLAEDDVPLASPEVLNELTSSGVPAHEIRLKVGALCLFMRNLCAEKGLVKNAKGVVLKIAPRVVVIRLLDTRQSFTLPRITFEFQPTGFPFTVVRKQVPVRLAYALTFNGCQGATLDRAVVDARVPIFAHGQRYASVSRCRNRVDCVALLAEGAPDAPAAHIVNNIVYPELVSQTED
ncbi:hypothetical protein CF327_g5868 [Tilletia walkeri]|nr:hypothetical protein CF327_g5868 [Tilletia walkeri]